MANDPKSGREKNEEDNREYVEGYTEGRNGDIVSDVINEFRDHDSVYFKGYKEGDRDRDGEPYEPPSSSSDDEGGCYLTTACVTAFGKTDNCLELRTLRHFRDTVLLRSPLGRKAIKEYYQMAPEVVSAINSRKEARQIWTRVYADIEKAVSLVKSGSFDEAFEHYKQMSLSLKRTYLK